MATLSRRQLRVVAVTRLRGHMSLAQPCFQVCLAWHAQHALEDPSVEFRLSRAGTEPPTPSRQAPASDFTSSSASPGTSTGPQVAGPFARQALFPFTNSNVHHQCAAKLHAASQRVVLLRKMSKGDWRQAASSVEPQTPPRAALTAAGFEVASSLGSH